LQEDLRPYCEQKHLEAFDDFVVSEAERRAETVRSKGLLRSTNVDYVNDYQHFIKNQASAGHYDVHARLRDMNYDGVACEVIFHGSQNGETLPFMPLGNFPSGNPNFGQFDPEMAAAGQHMYNRWLADIVSVEPERHIGLIQIPVWDPERAVSEAEWGMSAGLRGVNLPAPRPGVPVYSDPVWDRLWAACSDYRCALHTHGGAGDPSTYQGVAATALLMIEGGTWQARRALHFLIFGGVFERFPDLRIVFTETPGVWWPMQAKDYDSVLGQYVPDAPLRQQVPRLPSEYMYEHAYIGGSFISRIEATNAVENGYVSNVIWGRDYPHFEGTFQLPERPEDTPQTHLSLRFALAGLGADNIRRITGENAIRALWLDREALTAVAECINAPTARTLSDPVDEPPAGHGAMSFRRHGAFS
jgi:predicted TIM-barrel fold metal-dependent hydrolase